MKKHTSLKNPFIVFSPFLLLFVVLVLKLHSDEMIGDEDNSDTNQENEDTTEQNENPTEEETVLDAQVQVLMMMSGMTEQEAIDYINEGN